jgi:N-formylglutamate amidohydrolase
MNDWEPTSTFIEDDEVIAPFVITRPGTGATASPLVFASPHSGRLYPETMMAASRLDAWAIRRSEDAYVDSLVERAPEHGASLIAAQLARVYIDVNREPWDLDPSMFEDDLPAYARSRSARVAAGLGAIARVVREGEEIYSRKLCFAEARARIESMHTPYHNALAMLLREAMEAHGVAVLIDWHSMPAAAAQGGEIVLGDRFGGACAPMFSGLVERTLKGMGYVVARNCPYAGGFTTEHYGRPAQRVHALQIEVCRSLYMDESTLQLTSGFDRLRSDLEKLFEVIAAANWARL